MPHILMMRTHISIKSSPTNLFSPPPSLWDYLQNFQPELLTLHPVSNVIKPSQPASNMQASKMEASKTPFTPTADDLTRQIHLQNSGFAFEPGNPFIVHVRSYVHKSVLAASLGTTCKELSRQIFYMCMAHRRMASMLMSMSMSMPTTMQMPAPRRNQHDYRPVKLSFNIATAVLGPTPGEDDAEIVLAAIMWHLASLRDLSAVRDTYEKRGVCRGCDVVVLRLEVVSEVEDRVDWGFHVGDFDFDHDFDYDLNLGLDLDLDLGLDVAGAGAWDEEEERGRALKRVRRYRHSHSHSHGRYHHPYYSDRSSCREGGLMEEGGVEGWVLVLSP